MFGNNIKRGLLHGDGLTLEVVSIFKTIQGEGIFTGTPSVFVRLGGCNLSCKFCDTDFEDFHSMTIESIYQEIKNYMPVSLIVITGGEPMRQPIANLIEQLLTLAKVQIETNGTIYRVLPKDTYIVCSPKNINGKYMAIASGMIEHINAFKFLLSETFEGYHDVPDLGQKVFNIPVYVQPMDEYEAIKNANNIKYATNYALDNNLILSMQLHKFLMLP